MYKVTLSGSLHKVEDVHARRTRAVEIITKVPESQAKGPRTQSFVD